MKGFTSYICEIKESGEWVPYITLHDATEAAKWLKKAKKDGHTARVTERE